MINNIPLGLIKIISDYYSEDSYELLIFLKINKNIRNNFITFYDPNKYNKYGQTALTFIGSNKDLKNKLFNDLKLLLSLPNINLNKDNLCGRNILHELCIRKSRSSLLKLKLLLKSKKLDINKKINNKGFTPLILSCINSYYKTKQLLLNKNIDLNLSCGKNTALNISLKYELIDRCLLILKKRNININNKDRKGNTPLHISIYKTSKTLKYRKVIIKLLKYKKIRINIYNNNGYTPLHTAVKENNLHIVKLLLNSKKVNVNINTKNNQGNNGIDINGVTVTTPLSIACLYGHHKIIKYLINKNANINKNDEYLYSVYLFNKEDSLNNQLKKKYIDLGTFKKEIKKMNIRKNIIYNIFNKNLYPFIQLCNYNLKIESICDLINKGYHINDILLENMNNESGMDILIQRINNKNKFSNILKFIINNTNFKINTVWKYINKNIDIIKVGYNDIILKVLLENKNINPNYFDFFNNKFDNDYLELIKIIINHKKTNINLIDNKNNTLLHLACLRNNYNFVKLLVSIGANIDMINNDNETPIDISYKNKNLNILAYLYINKSIDCLKNIKPFRCNKRKRY